MMNTPKIHILAPGEWAEYKHLRLQALADSPDAFGSTLAREQDRPDSEWAVRLQPKPDSWNLPLAADLDGELIGLAWGHIEKSAPELANLYQMWVAPSHRQHGAGKMLLDAIITWASRLNARTLELGVTCGNNPALQLYTRAGFEPFGEPEPLRPGSELLFQQMRLKLEKFLLSA